MYRIYFDSNEGTPDGRYGLWLDKSRRDLAAIPGGPRDGMLVTIYMVGEIEAEATLQWDDALHGWTARVVEGSFRDNHETWDDPAHSSGPTFFNPPEVWQPFGPFSLATVQGEGKVVHLKGQVALDASGKLVGPGDMRAQLTQVLENIRVVLAGFGGEIRDIVSLTQYTTDMGAFMAAGDIRRAVFKSPYPVTTTVEVARLYDPVLLVEIAATAEVPRERFKTPT